MGVPNADEVELMRKAVRLLQNLVHVPLVLDSSNSEAIEAGLKEYPGRALINSVSGKESSLNKILPLAKKYGAALIALPIDEKGIPKLAMDRIAVVEKILKKGRELGLSDSDFLVDGLTLTASAEPEGVQETLKMISTLKKMNIRAVLGVSNISYGMPERSNINAAFLSMAIQAGLDVAIINPNNALVMNSLYAASFLAGKDPEARQYLKSVHGDVKIESEIISSDIRAILNNDILTGNRDNITENIKKAIDEGIDPLEINIDILTPALIKVGEKYEAKEYFLPQLILSAETMKKASEIISQHLKADKKPEKIGKIVMATVEGDVHDIGKNIVSTVLENFGFDVADIGKNVMADQIVKKTREWGADAVGLSALMTTTMVQMNKVIDALRQEGLHAKVVVGGAVLTEKYAESIGADGYAKDAMKAVNVFKKLINKKK
ncbi:MAG: cobalamin-dependent protein, partial [Candidatus Theseobacter exili]|nr:cobalamin-dependent protein [Candidatus Theseobacter exili]